MRRAACSQQDDHSFASVQERLRHQLELIPCCSRLAEVACGLAGAAVVPARHKLRWLHRLDVGMKRQRFKRALDVTSADRCVGHPQAPCAVVILAERQQLRHRSGSRLAAAIDQSLAHEAIRSRREIVEVLAASSGGPPELAAIGEVMRRHGLTPAAAGPGSALPAALVLAVLLPGVPDGLINFPELRILGT
jgi:hypothetical protein